MEAVRNETDAERYDRNWLELVQELRVAQTGVQILAGFLLTLPFTERFEEVPHGYHVLYLVAFGLAVLTTGLMLAPVMLHRFLFKQHAKDTVVNVGHRLVKAAMASLGLTMAAVTALIFGVVLNAVAAGVAAAVAIGYYVVMWVVVPMGVARRQRSS